MSAWVPKRNQQGVCRDGRTGGTVVHNSTTSVVTTRVTCCKHLLSCIMYDTNTTSRDMQPVLYSMSLSGQQRTGAWNKGFTAALPQAFHDRHNMHQSTHRAASRAATQVRTARLGQRSGPTDTLGRQSRRKSRRRSGLQTSRGGGRDGGRGGGHIARQQRCEAVMTATMKIFRRRGAGRAMVMPSATSWRRLSRR